MAQQEISRKAIAADIIIVGGGVIGLSIARALARRGVSDIVVFDKGELGKEASWAAGGILAPQVEADSADDFFKLARASRDLYSTFAQALHDETGIDVELDQTGTLCVAFTEAEEIELRHRFEWQQQADLRVEWLDSADLCRLEPNVSRKVRCALRFPNDWQVENRKLVEALIASNKKLGVTLLSNCEVTSIHVHSNQVAGIESASGTIAARIVVVCAGAWTSSFTTSTSAPIDIEPVRGQMLCFKPGPRMAHHVIYSKRGYLIPRRDGRLLAGSTSEHVGFDKRVTDEGRTAIKSMAVEIVPSLASEQMVDCWAGFRPWAPDDLPIIGPDADIADLFFATGHFRNGILLAPVTAEVIANLIVDDASSSFIEAFSPKRFCVANV